jgi:hypothetical protein
VLCYKNYKRVPVNFIGSIAFNFEEILRAEGEILEIKVGTIIQKPIFGLVNYHMKNHFSGKIS